MYSRVKLLFFFHTANFIRSYVHLYDVCVCVWRKELSGAEANKQQSPSICCWFYRHMHRFFFLANTAVRFCQNRIRAFHRICLECRVRIPFSFFSTQFDGNCKLRPYFPHDTQHSTYTCLLRYLLPPDNINITDKKKKKKKRIVWCARTVHRRHNSIFRTALFVKSQIERKEYRGVSLAFFNQFTGLFVDGCRPLRQRGTDPICWWCIPKDSLNKQDEHVIKRQRKRETIFIRFAVAIVCKWNKLKALYVCIGAYHASSL